MGQGEAETGPNSHPTVAHPWRLAAQLNGAFAVLILPFAIAATGAGATTLVGLAMIFAIGFPLAGFLLLMARPLTRIRLLRARVRRQRRPWRAAAGTAYSFATGEALRLGEPGWSRAHVILFAAMSGAVFIVVFGVIGRFVGDPPTEPGAIENGPVRYRPTS
jgi:hypothetical protein